MNEGRGTGWLFVTHERGERATFSGDVAYIVAESCSQTLR
jgi:hypothetical protein